MQRQVQMEPEAALGELPRGCDWGVKRDTDGSEYRWRGYKAHLAWYKAHLAWADGMIPLLCVTTSASVHDSQTAIPMMKRLSAVVTSLYDLMDSAYDAPAIKAVSVSLGHVPIIDQNRRRGPKLKLAPCEAVRYGERSNAQQRGAGQQSFEGLVRVAVCAGARACQGASAHDVGRTGALRRSVTQAASRRTPFLKEAQA